MKLIKTPRLNTIRPVCLVCIGLSAFSVPTVHADCAAIDNYSPGARAVYEFIESDTTPVRVDIEALFRTNNQTIFQVLDNERLYRVSYFTGCEDTGRDYRTLLVEEDVFTDYRVRELLQPSDTAWINGDDRYVYTADGVETQCTAQPDFVSIPGPQDNSPEFIGEAVRNLLDEAGVPISVITEPTSLQSCMTRYYSGAVNGAIQVDTVLRRTGFAEYNNTPDALILKIQRYADGRRDIIRLIQSGDNDESANSENPPAPANVVGRLYSPTTAEVSWARASAADNVVAYEVSRSGEVLDTRDALSLYDNTLQVGIEYVYSVVAIDRVGRRSSPSRIIPSAQGGFAPGPDVPSIVVPAPDALISRVYSETAGEVFWQTPQSSIDFDLRYEVNRNGITLLQSRGLSYFDDELSPGNRYNYSVVAIDQAGNRSPAAGANIVTPGAQAITEPLSMPGSFDVEVRVYSPTALELIWTDFQGVDSTGMRYDVYRDGQLTTSVAGRSWFTDALQASTHSEFRIVVFNAQNEQVAASRTVMTLTRSR